MSKGDPSDDHPISPQAQPIYFMSAVSITWSLEQASAILGKKNLSLSVKLKVAMVRNQNKGQNPFIADSVSFSGFYYYVSLRFRKIRH